METNLWRFFKKENKKEAMEDNNLNNYNAEEDVPDISIPIYLLVLPCALVMGILWYCYKRWKRNALLAYYKEALEEEFSPVNSQAEQKVSERMPNHRDGF
jgi:hypothetical protein